ncbi:MAG: IPT/TIG domain-containing protein, partial [Bacteroidia bacterium]|nr:IPT/TIG domain-containing protein [Bacteroidia bacterium]
VLAYKMQRNGTTNFIKELNQNDSIIVELSDTQEWMEVVCINKTKDDNGTASISFSFNTQPYISAIIPQKAKVGEDVSIRGSNLGNGTSSSIYINNQAVNLLKYLKSWTRTQIDFTVPDGASSGPVQVIISQVASNKIDFELIKSPPVIDSLGTFIGTKAFPGYSPWGGYDKWSKTISIFGKNWSADPSKTFVKVNGNTVPITNSGGQGIPADKLTIDMPALKGNIAITIESEGLTSEPKNFFVGIPPEVLHKMPVLGFRNTFIVKYNDHQDGNKEKTFASAFAFYSAYNQIESAIWTGNVLTVKGKIDFNNGNIDYHSLILNFSDDGTKVTSAECEIKSLNLDIKFKLNDLPVEVVLNGLQLSFRRLSVPAADYTFYSGTMRYTSPQISFPLSGMAEGEPSWPNDFYFWFDFKN